MAYEVPPLPYDYAALEPHIDEATMRLHHDKHHQAYVDKANAALEGTGEEDRPVEHILTILDALPEDKRTAEIVAAASASLPSDVLNLSRAFDGTSRPLYWDDVHHNEQGAEAAATMLFRMLRPKLSGVSTGGGAP